MKQDFFDSVQTRTEAFLTWRHRRRLKKKEKQKKKGAIRDWIEAFIWAAFVVLFINQYFFQAYRIPSPSMVDTLLVGDNIFVNKLVYGPELLPGVLKLNSSVRPQRGEIIIFENPSYISRGPVIDLLQRIIYMLTLTLVDIDRDENGEPRAHFLIKRAAAVEGDRLIQSDGTILFRARGEADDMPEAEFLEISGLGNSLRRIFPVSDYPSMRVAARAEAAETTGLPLDAADRALLQERFGTESFDTSPESTMLAYTPFIDYQQERARLLYAINPHTVRIRNDWMKYRLGWYVGHDMILPMGDNRDNSHDGRYFGSVPTGKILGRAAFRYWPLARIGGIR